MAERRQNLQPRSEEFGDAAWSKTGVSVSVNLIAAPDGTTSADGLLALDTTSTNHFVSGSSPVYVSRDWETFSCYVKAGAVSWCRLMGDNAFVGVFFQLTGAGVVGNVAGSNITDWSIESLLNGWYRCSITYKRTQAGGASTTRVHASNVDVSTVYTAGDIVTPQIYVWGGQLVEANWPGLYVKTVATAISTGRIRDMVIVKQNLLTRSEEFSNAAWTKNSATVTADAAVAPNGKTTADALIASDLTNVQHFVSATEPAQATFELATFSCYVKAGAVSWCRLLADGTLSDVHFNLTGTGAIGSTPLAVQSAAIQAMGDGWYRCSITMRRVHDGGAQLVRVYSASADNTSTYVAGNTSSAQIFLWGAQYVNANWAGPYMQTVAIARNPGRIRDLPAPLAQNFLVRSEEFSNAAWTKTSCTVTADAISAPDGTLTADALVAADTTNVAHILNGSEVVNFNGDIATFSCYVKAGAVSWVRLMANGASVDAHFQLTGAGAVGATPTAGVLATTIEPLASDWYRCSITFRRTQTGSSTSIRIYSANADNGSTYAAANAIAAQIYVWGAQYTETNWPGPYVKTVASAINTGRIRDRNILKQNLFSRSEEFSNAAWTKSNLTVVADAAVAPDGTTTADSVQSVTNAVNHHASMSVGTTALRTGVPATFSVYAKRTGNVSAWDWLVLGPNGSVIAVWFNLATMTVGQGASSVLATAMEDVGNGWIRCSVTFIVTTGASSQFIFVAPSDGVTIQNPSGVVDQFWWGAQMVELNFPGIYQKTVATAVNNTRVRDLVPPVQNLLFQSEDLSNASWTKSVCSVNSNVVANPVNGALTADALVDTGANSVHFVGNTTGNEIAGRIYTMSVFVKAGTRSWMLLSNNTASIYRSFDVANGVVGTATVGGSLLLDSRIEPVTASPGWFRCSITYVSNAVGMRLYSQASDGGFTYAGNTDETLYLFGMQRVEANWPGPYTKTVATAVNSNSRIRDVT